MKLKMKLVKTIDNIKTGQAARKERLAKGITMRELAKSIGVFPSYICDLEFGRRNWSYELEHVFNAAFKKK